MHGWTWDAIFRGLIGVIQWILAIGAVAGTLALLGWIFSMIFKRDKAR